MCEMFKTMNREMMDLEVEGDRCSVSGCKNKYIKIEIHGNCGVALCKDHVN